MFNNNDRKEIAGKLKALFPKASDSGREQLLNLLINCCCIDLCSINNNTDDIQFTGLTLLGNTLSLTLTINGVPTTQTVNLPTQIVTTLVYNGDGTFTYTDESNTVTTINIATLLVDAGISDGFVNNNDGTLTHTAIDGTVVTFDINDLLLTTTPLFTVNAGTTSVSTDASLGSQIVTYGDILHFWSNGSLNFNVQAGSVVVGIDTEADIIPYTPTTLASTNVGDALDELAANSHNPTTLTNTAAPFSWNVSTQAGNIPVSPTLVNNGNGTITFTSGTGTAPVTIDVTEDASEVLTTTSITINGTTYPANTAVETILSAISTYAGTTNLTYTPSATNGTIVSDTGTDAIIPSVTVTDAGLATPSLLANSHVPVTTTAGTVTITQSGTDNQTLKADITGISGATTGQVPSKDALGNITWITPAGGATITADNGLTETLGNIQLGGTLLHDTTVTQGSNKLVFERFALELVNTTKSILGLTGVNFVGEYTEDVTNFGPGVTAYFFNGVLSDGSGNTAVVIGKETVGGTYTRTTQILTGNEVMTISTDGNVSTTVEISTNTGFLTNVSDISGSATSIEHSTNRWMASIVGTGYQHSVQLLPQGLLYSNGNLPSSYLFPTADGANGEVMMTNGLGVVSFEPTTNIVANEWHTTGNAGTDGGATNFVGTTDAQDLVLKTNNVEIARFKQQGNTTIGSDLTSIDALYISPLSSNPGDMAFQSGQATGIMSTAFGASSATAPGSMAWGVGYKNGISPLASGIASTAWGDETSAAGRFSTCFGFQNTANAEYSTCFGQENTNNASYATVFGFQNTAEGTLSTVFGSANTVDIGGNTATIWGTGNLVSNIYGTAWGQDNFASGRLSTVFGKSSRAEALHSLASGFNNVASGDNSVVFGAYNNSVSYAEMVLGHYSTFYIPISITTINTADRLLTVGNGTDNLTKNNALTMWKDGRSMWNGDVAKQNTWIGVNGTNAQNFINVTTPAGNLAAISTEHTPSGNYVVLGSNAGNSGLVINNTKQFSFTTTAGTTSTALGATTIVANYSNTGFLFGGGGVATSTVDVNGTLGLSNTRISTANPVLTTNNIVYYFTAGTTGTVNMAAMVVDNRTFVLTNYSGVSLTLSNAVRTGSATTTTTLTDNTSMTIAYDGVEFFRVA